MSTQQLNYQLRILSQYQFDVHDDNIDVEIRLETGERYVATFFTLTNIQGLMDKYKESGECSSGQYFWAADMVIVRDLTEETIQKTVADLIETDDFRRVFSGPFTD